MPGNDGLRMEEVADFLVVVVEAVAVVLFVEVDEDDLGVLGFLFGGDRYIRVGQVLDFGRIRVEHPVDGSGMSAASDDAGLVRNGIGRNGLELPQPVAFAFAGLDVEPDVYRLAEQDGNPDFQFVVVGEELYGCAGPAFGDDARGQFTAVGREASLVDGGVLAAVYGCDSIRKGAPDAFRGHVGTGDEGTFDIGVQDGLEGDDILVAVRLGDTGDDEFVVSVNCDGGNGALYGFHDGGEVLHGVIRKVRGLILSAGCYQRHHKDGGNVENVFFHGFKFFNYFF